MARLALFLGLLLAWAGPADAGTMRVEVMDVGQGDSILITTPAGKRVLIDASTRRADVLGELLQRGVESLDLVVATHPHADHIGGMAPVIDALPVRVYSDNGLPHTTQVYAAVMDSVEARDVAYRPAKAGQTFKLDDDILIEVLFPPDSPLRGTRSDLNSNSVVLRLTHGQRCFLFTGDSEDPTEQELMRRGVGTCDVLKIAHHGSEHSTSTAWLRTVQPEIALVSCGVDNRYGHPGPETMSRLSGAGIEIYRTDTMGDIVVESDGQDLTVTTSGKAEGAEPLVVTSAGRRPSRGRPTAPVAPSLDGWVMPGGTDDAPHPVAPVVPVGGSGDELGAQRALLGKNGKGRAAAACAFISSRSSALYHPADCHVVDRIWEGNRVCWASEAAAQAAGKTRSRSCLDMGE